MLLTIDMGNTNIVLGCLEGERVLFTERMATSLRQTELEYAVMFQSVLELYGISPQSLDGIIISSVVPPLIPVLRAALGKLTETAVMVVGLELDTGLRLRMDNPAAVGSDLIVDAVAASAPFFA